MGCSDSRFSRDREFAKNYDALPAQIKMVFAKRYGFEKRGKLPDGKVNDAIRNLRQEVSTELAARREPPAARGDVIPNVQPTSRAAGGLETALNELAKIDYLLGEAELRLAVNPSPSSFGSLFPQVGCESVGRFDTDLDPESNDPKLAETREALEAMDSDRALDRLSDLPPHLATFIRAHVTPDKLPDNRDSERSIGHAVDSAIKLGLPSITDEAAAFDLARTRVGDASHMPVSDDVDHVCFICPHLVGKTTITNMALRGNRWRVADFGDTIPYAESGTIWDQCGKRLAERNKCLRIHLAAAGLCVGSDSDAALGDRFTEVTSPARGMPVSQLRQAELRHVELGAYFRRSSDCGGVALTRT